jgi:hypothetical protein
LIVGATKAKRHLECLEGLMERTKFHFSGGPRSRPALANIRFDLLQFFCWIIMALLCLNYIAICGWIKIKYCYMKPFVYW